MFFQSKQNNNYWYVLQEKAKFLQIFWMAREQVNKKQKNNHIWLHIYFNLLMYSLLLRSISTLIQVANMRMRWVLKKNGPHQYD